MMLTDIAIRHRTPGVRSAAWEANCIAIGGAAATMDPIHNVDLLAIQLGLVHFLGLFPSGADFAAERAEYNRLVCGSLERIRDFQALHYRLNPYRDSRFWARSRQSKISPELAHRIALFQARGEIAPYEDESFAPDSWRAFFIGHGVIPDSHLPPIDRTDPELVKARFRAMLGFVKEQVLRQPTHNAHLQRAPRVPLPRERD